jgi:hypothetical protein
MIPGNIPLILAGGGSYQINNSLRFRSGNSGFLSRTSGASPTNDKIFTWSGWTKLGRTVEATTDYGELVNGYTASTDAGFGELYFYNGALRFSGAVSVWRNSTAVFRDPSAWYHIILSVNTTQATAADRIKIYVNGTQVTSFTTSNDPTQNATVGINNASTAIRIGRDNAASSTRNMDGYMADVYFIDGQALTPSSFGQTNAETGVWVPKKYVGTFGNNGFFLEFKDASAASNTAIGKDSSGNSNHFTPSGISVTSGNTFDQMTDTATNNFCTLNPLDKSAAVTFSSSTLSITGGSAGGGSTFSQTGTTFGIPRTGKWYFEFSRDTAGADANGFGVNITRNYRGGNGWPTTRNNDGYPGYYSFEWGFAISHDVASNNITWRNNFIVTGAAVATNSTSSTATTAVYGFAIDCDNSLAYLYENGSLKTNSNGLSFTHPGSDAIFAIFKSDHIVSVNFGQRPFAYTPPTGFKALNTANLSVPTIKKPSTLMGIAAYTGNGSTQSISSLTFQPDLVWIKSRSAATTTNIFDSQRGVQKGIQSTGPNAEYTDANTLTAFNSTGFSLGSDASSRGVNINTNTYAAWNWKESNSAGLDIVLYTGNGGGARNIAHGLGVAPKWMFVRGRDARVWAGWHTNLTSAAYYMDLGTAAAEAVDTTMFDSTAPDASNFRVGSYNNVNAVNYVTYLWSEVSGFSRFGSYVGNASTDGPFVWCGFSPKWIVIKARSIATSWMIFNPTGTSPNEAILRVLTDTAGAETSNTYGIDYLSNGFKVRAPSGYSINNSGETYTFAAFAEAPFKYARAR